MKRIVSLFAAIAAIGIVGGANAADMPTKTPVKAAPVVAPAYNWTGFYIGAVGSYGWGDAQHCQHNITAFAECDASFPQTNLTGWQGGATVGYNWQWTTWVFGIEGDWSWGKLSGSSPSTTTFGCIAPAGVAGCFTDIKSTATIRGRVGWAFDRFLPYVTAGVAWNKLEASMGAVTVSSGDTTKASFVAGAGLEYAVWQNLSAKVEYLYISKVGDLTYDNGAACGPATPCYAHVGAINEVRFGLNYRFTGL